ncbi:MAG TPA: Ig-like domain-containing protein [Verrucomicrobiae bacterium]
MNAENNQFQSCLRNSIQSLLVAVCLIGVTSVMAQTITVSSVPTNNATGVSTSVSVVFTFSSAMNTTATMTEFYSTTPFGLYETTPVWSAGNTVLTCTPLQNFPGSTTINWEVFGEDINTNAVAEEGMFTTGTSTNGGGGTNSAGFGTNKYTSFVVGKGVSYDQFTADAPTLDANSPYEFIADIVLASNRTAALATLTLPNSSASNFESNPFEPDQFYLFDSFTNQSDLDTTFPPGSYGFSITGGNTNLQVTVNLPSTWTQPNAPHVDNFPAMQEVDPTQPLTVHWDAFSGAGAGDYVALDVSDDFSAGPLSSNTLSGTSTSVVIPANTFTGGNTYNATLAFLHLSFTTNVAGVYTYGAYVETVTQFSIITTNGIGGVVPTPPTFATPTLTASTINFTVNATANQNVTIQFNTDGLTPGSWQTLMTTNSGSGAIQVTDAINTANKAVFYRALIGP